MLLANNKDQEARKTCQFTSQDSDEEGVRRMAKAVSNQVLTFYDAAFFVKIRCNLLLINDFVALYMSITCSAMSH